MRTGPGSGNLRPRLIALHLVRLAGAVATGNHDHALVPAGPVAWRVAQGALDDRQWARRVAVRAHGHHRPPERAWPHWGRGGLPGVG